MIFITEDLAQQGGSCPVCGKMFRPNGIGPQDIPELATMLNNLPTSHVLKYGCNFHDWGYHFGGSDKARKEADDLMYAKNKWKIGAYVKWYSRPFYHAANYRNYWFVRTFGAKFFGKDGCKAERPA